MNRYEKSVQSRHMASHLNKVWGVGAAQGYYRETGDWYHRLNQFPAALFDAHGYILFPTEDALRASPNVQIGKQIGVPGGISSLPGYIRVADSDSQLVVFPDEIHAP